MPRDRPELYNVPVRGPRRRVVLCLDVVTETLGLVQNLLPQILVRGARLFVELGQSLVGALGQIFEFATLDAKPGEIFGLPNGDSSQTVQQLLFIGSVGNADDPAVGTDHSHEPAVGNLAK